MQEKILPRKLRTKSKSITDRFEPPNESIVCPLHGANGSTTNGSSHNVTRQNSSASNSPRLTQRQISNQSTASSNGSIQQQQQNGGGSISRKSSQTSTQQHLNSIKSPTSSMESYESALSTTNGTSKSISSSSSTLKSSNLAQPEDDDDLDAIGDCVGNNGVVGPPAKPKFECSRFTRQALYTYRAKNHLIHYKYHEYGGTCHDLPK